jgi:hypothetical protein
MKTINFFFVVFILFNFLLIAQFDPDETCPELTEDEERSSEQVGGVFKPASNDQNQYFRILIVFSQFEDDTVEDSNWPLNELPIYADDLLAQNLSGSYPSGTLSDYGIKCRTTISI